jgi:predicted amidohydrolase
MDDFALAIYQPLCRADIPTSIQDRLKLLDQTAGKAAAAGAQLILYPELFLSGYNIGPEIGVKAMAKSSPDIKQIGIIAKQHHIGILCGYPERHNGHIYNSAICFGPTGQNLANHRKLRLPSNFEKSHFTYGLDDSLFDLAGWKIGILICYDIEFPENARRLAQKGADLILVPTALGAQWGFVAESLIPVRAFENGLYLAYANYAGCENSLDYFGGSRIDGPEGRNRVIADKTDILIHSKLTRQAIIDARAKLPYLNDYVGLDEAR